jgi:hypothetical protein
MMGPERAARAVGMLEELRADIEADVSRRDGQPFDGPHVAVALGEICAQVDALANVLIEILRTPPFGGA